MPRFSINWTELVRVDAIAALVALTAIVWWFIEIPQRHAEAVNGAWQALNAAHGEQNANGGGRIEALERLLREGIALKGIVVSNAYLEGVDLSGADLETAHFDASRLANAKFGNSVLLYATFEKARLQESRFAGAKARYASFASAFLNRADFSSSPYLACAEPGVPPVAPTPVANLGPDDFDAPPPEPVGYPAARYGGLVLRRDRTNLYNASFARASLQSARFCGSYLYQATFDGADASSAKFVGVTARYASFRDAVLESADFTGADLTDADFSGACLLGANFSRTKLGGAKFAGARFGMDPNAIATSFKDAAMSDELRAVQRRLDDLATPPFLLSHQSAVVAYELVRFRNGNALREKRLQLGDPAEGPPSCPPPADPVAPVPTFGEY